MPQIEIIGNSDDIKESRWVAFATGKNNRPRRLGQINRVEACNTPSHLHKEFGIANHNALYVTNKGHWAKTLEAAADLLANAKAPNEFIVTGAILGLFPLSEALEESRVKPWSDYRVFQSGDGFWNAEELSLALSAS